MKLCECGCGGAPRAGRRFVRGHQRRRRGLPYDLQDQGYTSPCWMWNWVRNPTGYGIVRCRDTGRTRLAHRAYYEREKGPIPPGHQIDHLCKNPACVNPAHLEAVLPRVNVHRSTKVKLSDADVRTIRALRGVALATIAERFGITSSYASEVRAQYRSRKDVAS